MSKGLMQRRISIFIGDIQIRAFANQQLRRINYRKYIYRSFSGERITQTILLSDVDLNNFCPTFDIIRNLIIILEI